MQKLRLLPSAFPRPGGPKDFSPRRQPWGSIRVRILQSPGGAKDMAHTFANLLTHVIFSTKDRRPLISRDLKPNLLAYMG
jgi:hypothetical protein